MRRDIVWECLDRPGLEHLELRFGAGEIVAGGLVLVDLGEGVQRLAYDMRCGPDWSFRSAVLTLDAAGRSRRLELRRDEAGRWTVDGAPRPDLDGCAYPDVMVTPFTNTLPIRNLGLAPGETRHIRVAYVRLPEFDAVAAAQAYTRLDPAEPPARFRYDGLFRDFTAELAVDRDGVVIDYPPVWRRRAG
ncbi:putative glycolipid-binding domain-containing protein [Arenibaculum sp.]|jgi:hypothetical protein|uniref:putative glycolipid-binding domain-containing protein n=1 Tax=Arenibaculum sp. TaxID=2865862 RepID=UPI002E1162D6|nr:putative glycolipid-binding domain-containing protein [Arenibaculum sp.]